ncbi:hypothetical protein SAMN05660284_01333 [Formivibrio citricus]|uniref:Uncharacterized protein n=1 Tax=Formivibrio citricus TaxID=83765 RepID=A0A1I4YIF5_9NEIS|nr:hypothetical protein SAMN05660284_01333 [Formivibrio citricus]
MNAWFDRIFTLHLPGEHATHPQAALVGRMTLLLLVAGNDHASSSRLAIRPTSATFERVQLRFLG